jgi:dGTPase
VERLLINFLVGGLMHGTREAAEKIGAKTPDDVRHAPCRLARMTEESAQVNRQLKTFLAARMYETGDLVVHRRIVSEKVSWLFDYLIAHPEYISAGFRENLSNTALPRVVCDFIAGMTDAYFMRTYEALAQ